MPFGVAGPAGRLLRPRLWLAQLYPILLGALPLGLTAGVAIGAVVWMHLRGALQTVGGPGAAQYLPQALALAVVLEFGPIAAGLLVAGRTGASLGAELGSMRQTEQIDALEVLGQSPCASWWRPCAGLHAGFAGPDDLYYLSCARGGLWPRPWAVA